MPPASPSSPPPATDEGSSPSPRAPRSASPMPDAPVARDLSPLDLPASANSVRRPSVQFIPHNKPGLPSGSPKPSSLGRSSRKMSSPPPPPLFQPRVSFDTFDRQSDTKFDTTSFSLIKKHKDYEYSKRSRTFLCGLDANDYSEFALEWLIDELVDDGDEIVCLRVVEKDSSIAGERSVEQGRYRAEADTLMKHIQEKNVENKAINLILEFSVGKVQDVIDDMIKIYEPAILIVGTRGRSLGGFQGLLPGSVSKWVLQHSPVPVIVVRPNSKRAKIKRKRLQDPTRTGYRDLLDKSNPQGGHLLDHSNRNSMIPTAQEPPDAEAAAVAAAIGVGDENPSPGFKGDPLTKVESGRTDVSATYADSEYTGGDSSPETMRSPVRVMKSPDVPNFATPDLSEASSEEDDGHDDSQEKKTSNIVVDEATGGVSELSMGAAHGASENGESGGGSTKDAQ